MQAPNSIGVFMKIMAKKLANFEKSCKESKEYQIAPLDGNLNELIAMIISPCPSIWRPGVLTIMIEFRGFDIKKAPLCYFYPPIYHPNVDFNTGKICFNVIGDEWNESFELEPLMVALREFLNKPNCDSPFNLEAAQLYQKDMAYYVEKVLSNLNEHKDKNLQERLELWTAHKAKYLRNTG